MSTAELARVKQIAAAANLDAQEITYLATGSTSSVWHVVTHKGAFVIRVAIPHPGKKACFEADAGLRERLFAIGQRIAQPIATDNDHPEVKNYIDGEWAIDRFIPGAIAQRSTIPKQVCYDLGKLLANLHSLPGEDYGRLINRRDCIVGKSADLMMGINTRFQDPWPFSQQPLSEHVLVKKAPELVSCLLPLQDVLLTQMAWGQSVPLHADLHEKQLLIAGGRLAALIDFGDAMIGWPAWDIASFAYFHGWESVEWLLEGYSSDERLRNQRRRQACGLSIVIALHHASRSVTLRRPHRMQAALTFIRAALPLVNSLSER